MSVLQRARRGPAQPPRHAAPKAPVAARPNPTCTCSRALRAHGLTRRQRLLQLLGLVGVGDAQGVQVPRAADLELGHIAALLYLDGAGILPPGGEEELLDLLNLLGLQRAWRTGGLRDEPPRRISFEGSMSMDRIAGWKPAAELRSGRRMVRHEGAQCFAPCPPHHLVRLCPPQLLLREGGPGAGPDFHRAPGGRPGSRKRSFNSLENPCRNRQVLDARTGA